MSLRHRRTSIILVVACLSLLCFSCAKFSSTLIQGKTKFGPSNAFNAGVSAIEITPSIGQPMGGFGNDIGKVARGYWTKLFAKSYFLKDVEGNFVVIVTTDLWSFPAGLADYIMQKLQEDPNPDFRIARENILFSASHTHHSPGNYSTSFGYNLGSSAESGFDQKLFKFLGDRIVYCIKRSILNQEEATLHFNQINLEGLTRNRSIEAFLNNPIDDINYFKQRIPNPENYLDSLPLCLTNKPEVFQAVNPILSSVVIKNKDQSILAILNHFSVHPTVAGSDNPFYSGDIFRIAEQILENNILDNSANEKNGLITSFLNGAEGDVSANWRTQSLSESHRLGTAIGEAIFTSLSSALPMDSPRINIQLQFRDIRNQSVQDIRNELDCDDLQISTTANIPVVGKSVLKGTEDGRVRSN